MKRQILVKRYAQGLINTIKKSKEFDLLYRNLEAFERILANHTKLRTLLKSSFISQTKKKDVTVEVLKNLSLEEKTCRFLILLVENNRLILLPEILKLLPLLWNEKQGISSIEVSSVVPLSDSQKKKLQDKLEKLEKRPVSLEYKINPGLIGGLSIRKKNIIYDVSIKGSLDRLEEFIKEG